jgi:hypothetical protein
MWYSAGVVLFVVGAICVMVAGALVLDTAMANERRGLPWHEGIEGWAGMGLVGFAVEVGGFVLASLTVA